MINVNYTRDVDTGPSCQLQTTDTILFNPSRIAPVQHYYYGHEAASQTESTSTAI